MLDHKPVAVFCTYAINAGNALDKTAALLANKGAVIVGRRQFRRDRLELGIADFVADVRKKVTPSSTAAARTPD